MTDPMKRSQAAEAIGISERVLVSWVERHWIVPSPGRRDEVFDIEDISRACLIRELLDDLGANEASVEIILHLIDQLHMFRACAGAAGQFKQPQ